MHFHVLTILTTLALSTMTLAAPALEPFSISARDDARTSQSNGGSVPVAPKKKAAVDPKTYMGQPSRCKNIMVTGTHFERMKKCRDAGCKEYSTKALNPVRTYMCMGANDMYSHAPA